MNFLKKKTRFNWSVQWGNGAKMGRGGEITELTWNDLEKMVKNSHVLFDRRLPAGGSCFQ